MASLNYYQSHLYVNVNDGPNDIELLKKLEEGYDIRDVLGQKGVVGDADHGHPRRLDRLSRPPAGCA